MILPLRDDVVEVITLTFFIVSAVNTLHHCDCFVCGGYEPHGWTHVAGHTRLQPVPARLRVQWISCESSLPPGEFLFFSFRLRTSSFLELFLIEDVVTVWVLQPPQWAQHLQVLHQQAQQSGFRVPDVFGASACMTSANGPPSTSASLFPLAQRGFALQVCDFSSLFLSRSYAIEGVENFLA